jgi:predicted DNA-binding protein YlxM (UPF0122 family)
MLDDDGKNKEPEISKEMLSNLTVREAKSLRERFGEDAFKNDHTLDEIGNQFDITRARIKEIEKKALKKLGRLKRKDSVELACSFCGKKKSEVSKFIQANSGVTICNECLKTCTDIIDKDNE